MAGWVTEGCVEPRLDEAIIAPDGVRFLAGARQAPQAAGWAGASRKGYGG